MKIFYFNDEKESMTIRIVGKDSNRTEILNSQEGRMFEYDAPDNTIPFVKMWDYHILLLSYIDPSKLSEQPSISGRR